VAAALGENNHGLRFGSTAPSRAASTDRDPGSKTPPLDGLLFVYRLRPFINSDPPHLAAIWRSQPAQRGVLQPISAALLEYGVFSKMHFDPAGLIVALGEDGVPCGFVHAGFGPGDEGASVDTTLGTTHVLMIRGGDVNPALADELLVASEAYLRGRGASVIYGGGINPLNSFYLGLYGGSELPGVLQTDAALLSACRRADYREVDRVQIMVCDLASSRPPVSRELRLIKRTTQVLEQIDPPARSWWDASVWGGLQRDCFTLLDKTQNRIVASAAFWDMQPISAGWGQSTAGLYEMYVEPELRRRGYASYILGEAIRTLRRRGIAAIEAQTMAANQAARDFYTKLGFVDVDQGIVFRKDPAGVATPPMDVVAVKEGSGYRVQYQAARP
jgi:ribosomal protein S18 acetylase RimI-like enzyme